MCCLCTTFVGPLLSLDLNSKCAFEHLCFNSCLALLIMSACHGELSSHPSAMALLGKCGTDQTDLVELCETPSSCTQPGQGEIQECGMKAGIPKVLGLL